MHAKTTRYVIRTVEGSYLPFGCLSTAIRAAHQMADEFRHDVLVLTPRWQKLVYRAKTTNELKRHRYDVRGKRFFRLDFAISHAKSICTHEHSPFVNISELVWNCGTAHLGKTIYVVVAKEIKTYVPTVTTAMESVMLGKYAGGVQAKS